ncbi:MAG: Hsp20/alpha crystallin family protein [Spirochaetaceae bacterium]|jgi:HSP20 family protein|nr:Hsp20/alpha crystallin family protein [Spirochaetaceae bacterium]
MKTLALYRPVTIEKALNDFDRYMESFFGESPLTPAGRIVDRLPAVDVRETEGAYVLEAELPGYDEKEIEVHLDGRTLTIESRKDSQETKKGGEKSGVHYLIRERRNSSFSRSFELPENADSEAIAAAFNNGVLSLEIKKRAEAQKRIIEIERK